MRLKRQIIYLFLILIFLTIYLEGRFFQKKLSEEQQIANWKKSLSKYPPSKSAKEIELLYSFLSAELLDKEIYLWKAQNIARDHNGNIYVIDMKRRSLIKFDANGEYIQKAGRIGQGPGEFQNPYCMYVRDNRIIISDTGKHEILLFDLEMNFIKSFKVFKAYIAIAGSHDGKIIGAPMRMKNDLPLVDVMDDEGRILASFGKAIYGNEDNWNTPNWIKIDVNDKNEVYLAFYFYPTVYKYSMSGQLNAIYKINNRAMKEREKYNIKGIKEDLRVTWPVIYGIKAKKDGFFIMHNAPFTQILEYDDKGNQNNNYWFIRSYDYKAVDFIVKEEKELEFVLLQESPEYKIEVFRPKIR